MGLVSGRMMTGVVKHRTEHVSNNGSHQGCGRLDNSNMMFWKTSNVSVVPIHHFPPGTGRLVQENLPSTNLVVFKSTPRRDGRCFFNLRSHIFREQGIWNLPTGNSQSPWPEHAWYKWFKLNGSKISKTLDENIPLPNGSGLSHTFIQVFPEASKWRFFLKLIGSSF